jgi:hypothetical protein
MFLVAPWNFSVRSLVSFSSRRAVFAEYSSRTALVNGQPRLPVPYDDAAVAGRPPLWTVARAAHKTPAEYAPQPEMAAVGRVEEGLRE